MPDHARIRAFASRAETVIAVAFAAALPLSPPLLPILLAIMGLLTLLVNARGQVIRHSLSFSSPMPWMILFVVYHVIGLIWTSNWDHASLDLGIKAPMLILPVLLFMGANARNVPAVATAFVFANAFAVLLCLVRATVRCLNYVLHVRPDEVLSGYTASVFFFGSDLSWFLHPTYMAMYITFGLVLLAQLIDRDTWPRWLVITSAALLVIGVLLCSSKAGWLVLLVIGAWQIVHHWHERRLRYAVLTGMASMVITIVALFNTSTYVHGRLMQVVDSVKGNPPAISATSSTDDRRLVWSAAWPLFVTNWAFGVGTGDVKDELVRAYAERGYRDPVEKKLNAHDQFLNTGVALGVGAVLVLFLMLVLSMIRALRRKQHILAAFLVINALNWTVESMLEVQAGVMFFSFFACLFTATDPERIGVRSSPTR